MKRRRFLQTSIGLGPAAIVLGATDFPGILDSNVSLFHWPFRRLPLDATDALVEKLRSLGVARAWAGSFEGLFHRDLASANRRLVRECRRYPELVPIGSIDPVRPGWEEDLQRCVEEHEMPGIRVHPNLHGYRLDDPCFSQLLGRSAAANLFVQVAVTWEDSRTQPESIATSDVDIQPLPEVMAANPEARVQLLNSRLRGSQLADLARVPNLTFDTARFDSTDGVRLLIEALGEERVLFGSHAPFLIPEATLIRVHESALKESALLALFHHNAQRFLAGS